ncbi:MAG: bifunctional aspartate kinase/homoserine dehydrogenase I [Saprospiraceae bacterium]|jgi:aspartokinase/homoserine dehydrogenase 1|nr:bifunctional aspartate kinase/homoserine dehydrogenase I [bacterium]MDG1435680.1 bifunctional aspartate kinase/homoserine dehydrogenase I [Saprospiraceae bacterium]MDG2417918.1 bifunctional aspartate kinase/homoserine dehydrogenase I [Saprospiraceae bacterium]
MKVLKFGGSSVAKPERIKGIANILKDYYKRGEKFAVVFSAFGGVTDYLIKMSSAAANGEESYLDHFNSFSKRHIDSVNELFIEGDRKDILLELKNNHDVLKGLLKGVFLVREASPRTMDYVLSFGERNSNFIISHYLRKEGINANYLDARKVIKTDKKFGAAKVDLDTTFNNIQEYFTNHPEIQITTGFIASSKGGLTTTLGRGGSDFTAAILAAGLGAEAIEIWTDVDGVLTSDPRRVKSAFTIPSLTYAEAMEMSHFGAKVIYPPTIQPAMEKSIPIYIKNTFNPSFIGTYISKESSVNGHPIKGISSISDISLLTLQGSGLFGVPGIAARLFNSLAQAKINVILITQGSSEHSISFAVNPNDSARAKRKVDKEFEYEFKSGGVDLVKVENNLSIIAIIGENMRYQPGISGKLFQALGKNGINCVAIAQGSSELNVSVVINKVDESKALNSLHESFFLSDTKELHLFMVGVGLIGSTLLNQIQQQNAFLKDNSQLQIKVIGISNSRKMVFNENGINLESWRDDLLNSNDKADISTFIEEMKTLNLSNTIFVDNTANSAITSHYEKILDSSISISTPNKIATSSAYLQYERLKYIAKKRGVQFLYETNVGAGLPVISTLNDLIQSGDRILKIEGVLSGSLSFIFNSFTEGVKFSSVVKQAKELGFTEPDPRTDLNGIDVRRKLIILARESGLPLEQVNVKIDAILPDACQKAENVAQLFEEIEKADDYFEKMRSDAAREGKVLRFIAKLENGEASIVLQAVDASNPFHSLSGSDNMIVFTTDRYKERPLVILGPGAGAEVTAAGVFAEIITIGNFLS